MKRFPLSIIIMLAIICACSDDKTAEYGTNTHLLIGTDQVTLAKKVVAPDGIVSWWPGDKKSLDCVGSNDAVLLNGAGYADGLVKQAFHFDNEGWARAEADYALADGTSGIDELTELTLETWVRLDSDVLSNRIERFITIGPEGQSKAIIRHDGENMPGQLHFCISVENFDPIESHLRVNNALTTGVFHHVAGTFDGSMMRLYLDGIEVANKAVPGKLLPGGGYVRLSSPDEPLNGLLDEPTIYGRALTANEIQSIFNAGKLGKKLGR